ncbi:carboxypeptidase-like regulatory domain-containing protein [Dyadobacter diqingensis]|uniref:carboxypeptidase-like regulatory domain-containing protein n=1 Tax=Dyadobacter diqingensis TaxID=2938121 RepID=UPI00286D6A81|nr:TonB-dependent receptor plug domain-containing protein [Dyadobacter diqingensis]
MNKATFTNELGQFRFDNLVAAEYKIELFHLGFQSQILRQIVQDDQTAFVKIELIALEVSLSVVVVSSVRANDQQLIGNLDIKLGPITNSQEILRMVPGLFIGQHAGGGRAEQIFLRGFDLDMEPTSGLR